MKKMLLIIVVVFFSQMLLFSQVFYKKAGYGERKDLQSAIYVELLGSSGYLYNLSYDKQFYVQGKQKLSYALGFQKTFNASVDFMSAEYTFSPQFNYLYGITNFLEFGFGSLIWLERSTYNIKVIPGGVFRLGYRYQKSNNVFVKIALTPIVDFSSSSKFSPWFGFSVGYTFFKY